MEEKVKLLEKKDKKNEEYIAGVAKGEAFGRLLLLVKERDEIIRCNDDEIEKLNTELEELCLELGCWKKHYESLEDENKALKDENKALDKVNDDLISFLITGAESGNNYAVVNFDKLRGNASNEPCDVGKGGDTKDL